MSYAVLPISRLLVNRANDRHGELENETAAIAWLFSNQEEHMRNLARDIVDQCQIFEPPLVLPEEDKFLVFDGNRRITCLKLIENPRRSPTTELQEFFNGLAKEANGRLPNKVECRVETDRDVIDDILFRRHTGSQKGVGQTTWDDRMKANFVVRTGRGSGINVAAEIEQRLSTAGMLPSAGKIPLSNLNRLLSSEALRNRVGFSAAKGRFAYTHSESVVLKALRNIAQDLANQKVVLGDIWSTEGKQRYLDHLEKYKVLPTQADRLPAPISVTTGDTKRVPIPAPKLTRPQPRVTLIPITSYSIAWPGRLQRHREIWEELQYRLRLDEHINAISVLFRVLFELAVENYISQIKLATIHQNDNLGQRVVKVAQHLHQSGKIDDKYLIVFSKFRQSESLISADTMNRYVHSPTFAPSPQHLEALWDSLSQFIVLCLNA